MTAYLYKFTGNHFISLILPCAISILQVVSSDANVGQINTVANYVATFFAYQFLVIIPFGLFYLRCTQLTANEVSQAESLATDLMHNEPETISDISPHNSSRMNEYSMLVNANEESRLLHRKRLLDDTISSKENEVSNTERVLAASRRIYLFDWISDYFIGGSLRQSNFFAMSFVGSGFKTLFLMLLLVFWNVTSAVLVSMYEFLAS